MKGEPKDEPAARFRLSKISRCFRILAAVLVIGGVITGVVLTSCLNSENASSRPAYNAGAGASVPRTEKSQFVFSVEGIRYSGTSTWTTDPNSNSLLDPSGPGDAVDQSYRDALKWQPIDPEYALGYINIGNGVVTRTCSRELYGNSSPATTTKNGSVCRFPTADVQPTKSEYNYLDVQNGGHYAGQLYDIRMYGWVVAGTTTAGIRTSESTGHSGQFRYGGALTSGPGLFAVEFHFYERGTLYDLNGNHKSVTELTDDYLKEHEVEFKGVLRVDDIDASGNGTGGITEAYVPAQGVKQVWVTKNTNLRSTPLIKARYYRNRGCHRVKYLYSETTGTGIWHTVLDPCESQTSSDDTDDSQEDSDGNDYLDEAIASLRSAAATVRAAATAARTAANAAKKAKTAKDTETVAAQAEEAAAMTEEAAARAEEIISDAERFGIDLSGLTKAATNARDYAAKARSAKTSDAASRAATRAEAVATKAEKVPVDIVNAAAAPETGNSLPMYCNPSEDICRVWYSTSSQGGSASWYRDDSALWMEFDSRPDKPFTLLYYATGHGSSLTSKLSVVNYVLVTEPEDGFSPFLDPLFEQEAAESSITGYDQKPFYINRINSNTQKTVARFGVTTYGWFDPNYTPEGLPDNCTIDGWYANDELTGERIQDSSSLLTPFDDGKKYMILYNDYSDDSPSDGSGWVGAKYNKSDNLTSGGAYYFYGMATCDPVHEVDCTTGCESEQ